MTTEEDLQPSLFEGQPAKVDIGQVATSIAAHARPVDTTREFSEAAQDQGWQNPNELPPKAPKPKSEERFKEKFDWVPHSQGELKPASQTLRTTISRAARNSGYSLGAIEKILGQAEGYRDEALRDMTRLRQAFAIPNERDSLSADEIRNNPDVLSVLAKHQFFAEALKDGKVPPRQKGSAMDKKLSPVVLALYSANTEVLESLWGEAFQSSSQREQFWRKQIESVDDL